MLTPTIQKFIDQWVALRDRRIALLTYVARDIAPRLREVLNVLETYISTGKGGPVDEAVYLDMADEESALYGLLPLPQRVHYLRPFLALHDDLVSFNREADRGRHNEAVAAARSAVRKLEQLLK